jgi:hypothetical protein
MKKNTIQLAKKSTVLVLGLFIQINFAHSFAYTSTCTGKDNTVKGVNLNKCQTFDINAKIEDLITVIVKTTLPDTKLVINTRSASKSPVASNKDFVITTQYSEPGVYKSIFRVKNYMPNTPLYAFNARGETVNNQSTTPQISPMSVTISNTTEINAQKKNSVKPF